MLANYNESHSKARNIIFRYNTSSKLVIIMACSEAVYKELAAVNGKSLEQQSLHPNHATFEEIVATGLSLGWCPHCCVRQAGTPALYPQFPGDSYKSRWWAASTDQLLQILRRIIVDRYGHTLAALVDRIDSSDVCRSCLGVLQGFNRVSIDESSYSRGSNSVFINTPVEEGGSGQLLSLGKRDNAPDARKIPLASWQSKLLELVSTSGYDLNDGIQISVTISPRVSDDMDTRCKKLLLQRLPQFRPLLRSLQSTYFQSLQSDSTDSTSAPLPPMNNDDVQMVASDAQGPIELPDRPCDLKEIIKGQASRILEHIAFVPLPPLMEVPVSLTTKDDGSVVPSTSLRYTPNYSHQEIANTNPTEGTAASATKELSSVVNEKGNAGNAIALSPTVVLSLPQAESILSQFQKRIEDKRKRMEKLKATKGATKAESQSRSSIPESLQKLQDTFAEDMTSTNVLANVNTKIQDSYLVSSTFLDLQELSPLSSAAQALPSSLSQITTLTNMATTPNCSNNYIDATAPLSLPVQLPLLPSESAQVATNLAAKIEAIRLAGKRNRANMEDDDEELDLGDDNSHLQLQPFEYTYPLPLPEEEVSSETSNSKATKTESGIFDEGYFVELPLHTTFVNIGTVDANNTFTDTIGKDWEQYLEYQKFKQYKLLKQRLEEAESNPGEAGSNLGLTNAEKDEIRARLSVVESSLPPSWKSFSLDTPVPLPPLKIGYGSGPEAMCHVTTAGGLSLGELAQQQYLARLRGKKLAASKSSENASAGTLASTVTTHQHGPLATVQIVDSPSSSLLSPSDVTSSDRSSSLATTQPKALRVLPCSSLMVSVNIDSLPYHPTLPDTYLVRRNPAVIYRLAKERLEKEGAKDNPSTSTALTTADVWNPIPWLAASNTAHTADPTLSPLLWSPPQDLPGYTTGTTLSIHRASAYVSGRYTKLVRGISQTPWFIQGKRKQGVGEENVDAPDDKNKEFNTMVVQSAKAKKNGSTNHSSPAVPKHTSSNSALTIPLPPDTSFFELPVQDPNAPPLPPPAPSVTSVEELLGDCVSELVGLSAGRGLAIGLLPPPQSTGANTTAAIAHTSSSRSHAIHQLHPLPALPSPLAICAPPRYTFHSAGREDVDVRMLGTGRPFIIELLDPRPVLIPLLDYIRFQNYINTSTTEVITPTVDAVAKGAFKMRQYYLETLAVETHPLTHFFTHSNIWNSEKPVTSLLPIHLYRTMTVERPLRPLIPVPPAHPLLQANSVSPATRIEFSSLQAGADSKRKMYCALAWSKMPLPPQEMLSEYLSHLRDIRVYQKTPIRVLHRRSLLTRQKMIHQLQAVRLNDHYCILTVLGSAGTYIKEFVHSDLGRTQPALGDLLQRDYVQKQIQSANSDTDSSSKTQSKEELPSNIDPTMFPESTDCDILSLDVVDLLMLA